MMKNNLCLEEYISTLSQFVYGEHHLEFTDDEGKGYEIYYIPADMGADSTNVPVPAGKKYDISGNNIDGFIVTLYKNGEDYIQAGEEEEAPTAPSGYTAGGDTAEGEDADTQEENAEETAEAPEENAENAENAESTEEIPAD